MDKIGILVDVLASAIGALTNPSKIANTFTSELRWLDELQKRTFVLVVQ